MPDALAPDKRKDEIMEEYISDVEMKIPEEQPKPVSKKTKPEHSRKAVSRQEN